MNLKGSHEKKLSHPCLSTSSGTHNRFFPSRADAWMFRQYAYDFAGLTRKGVNSHDNHPPRKITIITRKRTNGRMFDNQDELVAAATATGLEVEIVQDLGKLPFKKVRAATAASSPLSVLAVVCEFCCLH